MPVPDSRNGTALGPEAGPTGGRLEDGEGSHDVVVRELQLADPPSGAFRIVGRVPERRTSSLRSSPGRDETWQNSQGASRGTSIRVPTPGASIPISAWIQPNLLCVKVRTWEQGEPRRVDALPADRFRPDHRPWFQCSLQIGMS